MKKNIVNFCKENKDLITKLLNENNLIIEELDDFMVGYKEKLDKYNTCHLIEDNNTCSIQAKQKLKNHNLSHRWVSVDLSFKKKKYALNINNNTIFYNYCIL